MRTFTTPFSLKSAGLLLALPLCFLTGWATASEPANDTDQPKAAGNDIPQAAPIPAAIQPKTLTAPQPAPKPAPAPGARLKRGGSVETLEAEQLLADMGYWTGPVDGVWDEVSRSAIMAFQKVEGRKRTGKLSPDDFRALRATTRPEPLEGGAAHVEVDIARQVLFFVDDSGSIVRILPVSTGNGKDFVSKGVKDWAYTPRGRCTVYNKIQGMRRAPLGDIFYPNYLVGGIAIHGSPSIPPNPASHGCIRIPMWAAKEVSQMTPVGTLVIVHEAGSTDNSARWVKQAKRFQPQNSENLLSMN